MKWWKWTNFVPGEAKHELRLVGMQHWHTILAKHLAQIVVFHSKFSPRGQSELLKCKALSRVIGHSNINRNADKVILVHRAAALNAFAANIHGMALTASAKVLGKDGSCEALTSTFWDRKLLGKSKEVVASAIKHKQDRF